MKTPIHLNRCMPASGSDSGSTSSRLLASMHGATADMLKATRMLKADDVAPVFTLGDLIGNEVTSSDLLAQGPLLVTFYRGICHAGAYPELQAMQAALPRIGIHGVKLVAISGRTPAVGDTPIDEKAFDFSILGDSRYMVADAFGLRVKLPKDLESLYYRVFKNELGSANSERGWTLPMPACFLIAPDGVITYAEVNPDFDFDAVIAHLMSAQNHLNKPM